MEILTLLENRKKCDGKRPSCLSCKRKGISCKFPANIRIFQYQKGDIAIKKSNKSDAMDENDTNDFAKRKKNDNKSTKNLIGQNGLQTIEDETKNSLLTLSQKIEGLLQNPSIIKPSSMNLEPRSDSITSLETDTSTSETDSIILPQPPTPTLPPSSYQLSEAHRATNMVHGGESITNLLDKMTIDLIKRSIENLQYIDFDKKAMNINHKIEIRNGKRLEEDDDIDDIDHSTLGNYLDNVVPDDLIFQPDEYLSFD